MGEMGMVRKEEGGNGEVGRRVPVVGKKLVKEWWFREWGVDSMSAKMAVLVAVSSTIKGRRGSCDIVSDSVDKGGVRSSEGFDRGQRVFVDGIEEVLKGAMEDETWRRWRWVT